MTFMTQVRYAALRRANGKSIAEVVMACPDWAWFTFDGPQDDYSPTHPPPSLAPP